MTRPRGHDTPLLEREGALAALDVAIDGAAAGEGRCVVIEGAAGIGKTSLLRAARGRAAEAGLQVLGARGSELEQPLAYGVVRQLFERRLAHAAAAEREELLSGAAGLAAALLGVAGHPLTADEEATFAVQHGLYWLAANLADRRPTMLALDDLHWADPASLRWLAYLAHRIEGLPMLVLATVRPLAGEGDPVLADLLGDPATLVVRPASLSPAAAAAIISGEAGAENEVTRAAHAATAGNPLLLRELAAAMAETASADPVAEVSELAHAVVARRVRLTLSKLGPDAGALARAVAIAGDDAASLSCVPELAGLEGERLAAAGTQLVRAEILRADPLRFTHPLVRRAVYDAMAEVDRGVAHRRAAALLARSGAPDERIAAQLLQAPPAGDPETVAQLRAVSRQAVATGAPETARTFLERALQEGPAAAERADLLTELAAVEGLLGIEGAVEHLRSAVALLPDPARRAAVRHELARGLIWRDGPREAVAELELARSEAPSAEAAFLRRLEADACAAALRVPELHQAALARLDALQVDGEDDGAQMLRALKAYAVMLRGERRAEAVVLAERALADGLPSEHAPSWSLWGAVSALVHADRHEPALRVVEEAIANARRRGAAYLYCGSCAVRASILHTTGSLVDAEADARAAVEALPDRGVMVMPLVFGVLAEVLVERARLEDAAATLAQAGADGTLPEAFGLVPLLSARAALRLAQGDAPAAAADALAAGRALESVGFRNPSLARWRGQAAMALLQAGDSARAGRLAAEQLDLARRWGSPRAVGAALRASGLVAGGPAGLALLRESCAVLDGSPAMLERALSVLEYGAALRRAGQRVEARTALRSAADLARRCGAALAAQRAHDELLAAGAKPRSTALSGVESLTPSERRVAAMATEGMANREIAQALFVTLRTVEMHLSNAFRKLGVTSRTQLVDALAARPAAARAERAEILR